MKKLTKSTVKIGQICVLTIKSNLYEYYIQRHSEYNKQDNLFSYQTKTSLKRITDFCRVLVKNEYIPLKIEHLKTLEKNIMVKILDYDNRKMWIKGDLYTNIKFEVISGTEKGIIFFSDLQKIQGRLKILDLNEIRLLKINRINGKI